MATWRDIALAMGVDQNNPAALAAAGIVPDYSSTSSSGGGGGGGPNFDWAAARSTAYNQLSPYYEQKLRDAKGDVERAKRLIQEDYDQGNRYRAEDTGIAQTAYNTTSGRLGEDYTRNTTQNQEDFNTAMQQYGLDTTDETRDTRGKLNNRGVLVGQMQPGDIGSRAPDSGYAKDWILNPMEERQAIRKQTIERALNRQNQVAGITKTRGTEDASTQLQAQQRQLGREGQAATTTRTRGIEEQDINYPRTQQALQEEQRSRAYTEVAPMMYQEALTKYNAANKTV